MHKGLLSGAIAASLLLLASDRADAGLTVSLKVNGEQVALTPLFPNSGTPDTNGASQNGLVMVAGLAFDVDNNLAPDLFIDTLSVFANKTASEGVLETINVAARVLGSRTVEVVVEVFDVFALPVTVEGTPLEVTSSFSYVNPGLSTPITLQSYLDGQELEPVTVSSEDEVPKSDSGVLETDDYPFELKNTFTFNLRPNDAVAFKAETSAALAAGSIAHAPEPASLVAWGSMIALAGLVYASKRRRTN
jgi:hypothetical protein